MSVDRPLRLDVAVPDFGARSGDGFAPGQQPRPDPGDRERFEQAMAAAPAAQDGEADQIPRPFALFGGIAPAAPAAPAVNPEFARQVADTLAALMVDDEAGSRQVRMELKDDHLPGVTVVVREADGRLQVDFVCSVEASRLRLNAAVPEQAPLLAQRLARPVLLRVQTDDDEDPCLFEVAASP
ncbi:MAG TPA: hypothetical protein VFE82_18750 [Ramlibacter sp.]|jgi:hypothetical protein|uniref:hypothetical protein n=1 Tax=Ramlibacter sp. TaxID=1917967 RepID=UPI002D68E502|nr:hypothetical protein [Ramlibacter sp.]HZY20516.1 hypothetical protein [Ramlibacter sp.]